MGDVPVVQREWVQELVPERARIRCRYRRRGKQIVAYTAQLEARHQGSWRPVVRFDNAHGFCHRDDIHADGTQEKTPTFVGGANETFTKAIDELQTNWEAHVNRFLRETER